MTFCAAKVRGAYAFLALFLLMVLANLFPCYVFAAPLLGCSVWSLLNADKNDTASNVIVWYSIYGGVALTLSLLLFVFFPKPIEVWKDQPVVYFFVGLAAHLLGRIVPFANS